MHPKKKYERIPQSDKLPNKDHSESKQQETLDAARGTLTNTNSGSSTTEKMLVDFEKKVLSNKTREPSGGNQDVPGRMETDEKPAFSEKHFDILNHLTLNTYDRALLSAPPQVSSQLAPVRKFLEYRERGAPDQAICNEAINTLRMFEEDVNNYSFEQMHDPIFWGKMRVFDSLTADSIPLDWDVSQKNKVDQVLNNFEWDKFKKTCYENDIGTLRSLVPYEANAQASLFM